MFFFLSMFISLDDKFKCYIISKEIETFCYFQSSQLNLLIFFFIKTNQILILTWRQ